MNKIRLLFVIVLLFFWGCLPPPQQKESTTADTTTAPAVLSDDTNIHFTGKYCDVCHEQTPVAGGGTYLKYNGDYQLLCRCHPGQSPGYCHPLEIISPRDPLLAVPAGFPLQDGKFSCKTCHDMYRQCQKRQFDRYTLRGAPYPRKTDFCFNCHNEEAYNALNVHYQLKADGTIEEKRCLYCHAEKPDEKTATYPEVTFIGDLRALCRRCHQIEGNHPGDFNHMEKLPTAKAVMHMTAMEKTYHIILPLAQDGKMTCVTCHNPHQKGVIAMDIPSAQGADSKNRERLPGKLCITCHQM